MYRCVLFDLDGTLANTYKGICSSYQYAFRKMGLSFPSNTFVKEAIGAPLLSVFRERFSLTEEEALEAVAFYREYYASKGKYEATVYEGMKETLTKLKEKGLLTGVATLKRHEFAEEMLEALGLSQYFDIVCGIDDRDRLSKADLLKKCTDYLKVGADQAILVGDSFYDFEGARKANMDFMAVTYGFGYSEDEMPEVRETDFVVRHPKDILLCLCIL